MLRLFRELRRGVSLMLGLALALLLSLGGGPGGFGARSAWASPLGSVPTVSVTVPAGGSAALQVKGLALQRGAGVPQGALSVAGQPLPEERVRVALYYGVNWGYVESDPQQVALAVWWAQDGTWPDGDHATGERIGTAAAGAPGLPSWNPEGRSLLSLVSQGQVSISQLSLSPAAVPALGSGVLTVHNTTSQDVVAYLPYGTVFTGADGSALVWSVGAATAQATAAPAQPTATATATVTSQPQPSPTSAANVKPGYTPPTEEAAPSPVVEEPTATATPAESKLGEAPTATQVAPDPPAVQPDPAEAVPKAAPTQSAPVPAQPTAASNPGGVSDADAPKQKPGTPPEAAAPVAPVAPAKTEGETTAPAAASRPEAPKEVAKAEGAPARSQSNAPASISDQAPPLPLITPTIAVPGPVGTTQAQPTKPAPRPEGTNLATIPAVVLTSTPTTPATRATNTVAVASTQPVTQVATQPPTQQAPTPATAALNEEELAKQKELEQQAELEKQKQAELDKQKEQAAGLPAESNEGPVITVAPAPTPAPAPTRSSNPTVQQQSAANGANATGARPTTNPTTGGGQSAVPTWLALFSAIMVLGGWSLRRMAATGSPPQAVKAEAEDVE